MRSITFFLISVLLIVLNCSQSVLSAPKQNPLDKRCVYIKNVHFNEYLYASSSVGPTSKRVRIFTWMKKTDGHPSNWATSWGPKYTDQAVWLLKQQIDCDECFRIDTVYFKTGTETLFSVANTDPEYKSGRPRRPVYAYHVADVEFPAHEGEHIWRLEAVPDGRAGQVRIQSKSIGKATGEYLYAVGDGETYDKDRRSVFTWSSKEDSEAFSEQGEWLLEKATCPSHVAVF